MGRRTGNPHPHHARNQKALDSRPPRTGRNGREETTPETENPTGRRQRTRDPAHLSDQFLESRRETVISG